jgi:hypothetical protein
MYLYEHSKTITSVVGRNYSRSSSEAKFVAYTTARASKRLRARPLSHYVYIACADSIPELYLKVERLKVQESSRHNHFRLTTNSAQTTKCHLVLAYNYYHQR